VSECFASFGEITVDCELPAGHEGEHMAVFTWDQDPPADGSSVPVSPGWLAYLLHKYDAVPDRE
jgi:hypothetical protein